MSLQLTPSDVVMFRIEDGLEHIVTSVTGGVSKIAWRAGSTGNTCCRNWIVWPRSDPRGNISRHFL
jgi:hypothetical protein